jgi:hypothetical protein
MVLWHSYTMFVQVTTQDAMSFLEPLLWSQRGDVSLATPRLNPAQKSRGSLCSRLVQVNERKHVFSGHHSFHKDSSGASVGALSYHTSARNMDDVENDREVQGQLMLTQDQAV